MPKLTSINRLHNLVERSLFYINPTLDYGRIIEVLEALGNAVHAYESDDTADLWSVGEFGHSSLPDTIEGAYWHLTDWHEGEGSTSYYALCALGSVFNPGMSTPNPDNEVYKALEDMADDRMSFMR